MKHFFTLILSVASYASFSQPALVDKTFGNKGKVLTSFNYDAVANDIAIAPDGKIAVVGYRASPYPSPSEFAVAKYNDDGSPDISFGVNGKVTTLIMARDYGDGAYKAVFLPDNNLLVMGYSLLPGSGGNRLAIVKYKINGTLDSTFGTAGEAVISVRQELGMGELALLSNGDFIVSGTANNYNQVQDLYLAKFKANGSLDSSFGNAGIITTHFGSLPWKYNVTIRGMGIQPGGKIVVAGTFPQPYGGFVVRYNVNGSADNSFGVNGKATLDSNIIAYSMAMQQDAKIVVGGQINTMIDSSHYDAGFFLKRFTSNGTPDTSFGLNSIVKGNDTAIDEWVTSIKIQDDGKIVGIGQFLANAFSKSGGFVSRWNKNSQKDTSFGKNGIVAQEDRNFVFTNHAMALAIQQDGKILISGTYNNQFGLIRLLGDEENSVLATFKNTSNEKNGAIKLFPNPVISQLYIQGLTSEPAECIITDILGNVVIKQKISVTANTLSVAKLKNGRYIATVLQNDTKVSIIFIKQ